MTRTPKIIRWTASEFLKHLEDLDASRFEETPVLADSSSSSLAQHKPLRTSLDSTRLAALEVRTFADAFSRSEMGSCM